MDWFSISDKAIKMQKKKAVDGLLKKGYSQEDIDRLYSNLLELVTPIISKAFEDFYDE